MHPSSAGERQEHANCQRQHACERSELAGHGGACQRAGHPQPAPLLRLDPALDGSHGCHQKQRPGVLHEHRTGYQICQRRGQKERHDEKRSRAFQPASRERVHEPRQQQEKREIDQARGRLTAGKVGGGVEPVAGHRHHRPDGSRHVEVEAAVGGHPGSDVEVHRQAVGADLRHQGRLPVDEDQEGDRDGRQVAGQGSAPPDGRPQRAQCGIQRARLQRQGQPRPEQVNPRPVDGEPGRRSHSESHHRQTQRQFQKQRGNASATGLQLQQAQHTAPQAPRASQPVGRPESGYSAHRRQRIQERRGSQSEGQQQGSGPMQDGCQDECRRQRDEETSSPGVAPDGLVPETQGEERNHRGRQQRRQGHTQQQSPRARRRCRGRGVVGTQLLSASGHRVLGTSRL